MPLLRNSHLGFSGKRLNLTGHSWKTFTTYIADILSFSELSASSTYLISFINIIFYKTIFLNTIKVNQKWEVCIVPPYPVLFDNSQYLVILSSLITKIAAYEVRIFVHLLNSNRERFKRITLEYNTRKPLQYVITFSSFVFWHVFLFGMFFLLGPNFNFNLYKLNSFRLISFTELISFPVLLTFLTLFWVFVDLYWSRKHLLKSSNLNFIVDRGDWSNFIFWLSIFALLLFFFANFNFLIQHYSNSSRTQNVELG